MRVFLFCLFGALVASAAAVKCHSCLTHCRTLGAGKVDPAECDCLSNERDMCEGNACFAKMEIFTDEKTAIMQKGCITDIPGGSEGCNYASSSETIHCFCTQEGCNQRTMMRDFIPGKLPTVQCCACSERQGEQCEQIECARKCTGNYCVVDFDGAEQGCGLGFPRLQSFLRMEKYVDWQGHAICSRYEASPNTVMNGCTCTQPTGKCNEFNRTRSYQVKNVIERIPKADMHYCYSLAYKSNKQFGAEVFRKSTTCEGQYCFVSYTTSEIVLESAHFEHSIEDHQSFIGHSRPKYEILAGCLKVDDDRKVSLGCTTEYVKNSSEPLAKHCICDHHLCNFHHLITDTEDTRTLHDATPTVAPQDKRVRPTSAPRPAVDRVANLVPTQSATQAPHPMGDEAASASMSMHMSPLSSLLTAVFPAFMFIVAP